MEEKTWIDEMIERQATPEPLREETTKEFCLKWNIPESNYYYHVAKKENQKKILELSLGLAKKYTADILENLGVRAKSDNKAAELFMDYVLQLSKNVDIKTNGESIAGLTAKQIASLEELLYDKQSSNGQNNNGYSSGEDLSV
jgi:alcohol dehydrogenase class IV